MAKHWRWRREDSDSEVIGLVAALLGIIGFFPLLWRIWQRKEADDFSWGWAVIRIVGVSLWLIYAWRERLLPVLINNIFFITFVFLVIFIKLHFDTNEKPHLPERGNLQEYHHPTGR